MELTSNQLHRLLQRFPTFELSYETLTHKKVPDNYNVCLGVPAGRKYFLWYTFYRKQDVCYLLELNKDKRIVRATITHTEFPREYSIGTILYGSLVSATDQLPYFVLEDLYFYKGIPLKHLCFADKLPLLKQMFEIDREGSRSTTAHFTPVYLPFMWNAKLPPPVLPYTIHHIQYRELHRICPYLNVISGLRETIIAPVVPPVEIHVSQYIPEYHKPQYRFPTIFRVVADIQYDIYHLYACGQPKSSTTNKRSETERVSSKENVYYDIAYIPNYVKSVFMNGLFRNIRENRNLDYIEESDEDEDFEDTREDKYVDIHKELFMECVFHPKFKRWVPMRVVNPSAKVVHIHKLAR